jgi:hypothetical protein
LSVPVHADELFGDVEIADSLIEFFEAIECTVEYVQIFREGYVLYIAESYGNVFDVDLCGVVVFAELFGLFMVEEFGGDDVVFVVPPLHELEVLLEFVLGVEEQVVLLDVFTCEVVAQEAEEALIRAGFASQLGHLVPVVLVEGGWFI